MRLQVQLLPLYGLDGRVTQPLTSFLVNDTIAIDAGSLGFVLNEEELLRLEHVILTHAHVDHTASLPIAVAEIYGRMKRPWKIYGTPEVLDAVRRHLFNAEVWVDFPSMNLLGSQTQKCLEFIPITHAEPFVLEGLRFTPVPVQHPVPTVGLLVETPGASVVFTSDTTHTEALWSAANELKNLRAVFIDCSFPNEFEKLAVISGHMTPHMVGRESRKLATRPMIYCVHLKPSTRVRVAEELLAYEDRRIAPIVVGKVYQFGDTTEPAAVTSDATLEGVD